MGESPDDSSENAGHKKGGVRGQVPFGPGGKIMKGAKMLTEKQDAAFNEFYKSARYNEILGEKTTLLIHLATAMSAGCYP